VTDIEGGVEIRSGEAWSSVLDAAPFLQGHSDLFGCLFGVRNMARFRPLFADRGLPSDCSELLERQHDAVSTDSYGETWLTWDELMRVSWEEAAEDRDERVHEYLVREDGSEEFVTKWLDNPGHMRVVERLRSEDEFREGNRVYRRPILKRKAAIESSEFPVLMERMAALAQRWGPTNVRLVVWFFD